jgi:integrase
MEAWLDEHPEWRSDWTKNSALRNVQAAFNWAWKKGVIDQNPFRGVSHRAGLPRRDMKPAEFQALLRATRGKVYRKRPSPGARFRQLLIFLWYTGCRPQEACELRWSDVRFDEGMIVLTEHKTIRTQSQPRPRVVPMDPIVVKLLRWIKRLEQPGEHVFLTFRKTPWERHNLSHRMRRARQAASLPADVKLYGVRHAFGTRGVMNQCDLKTLSALMGHTTTRMTEYYVHLSGQRAHLAAAMQLVNARRRGA